MVIRSSDISFLIARFLLSGPIQVTKLGIFYDTDKYLVKKVFNMSKIFGNFEEKPYFCTKIFSNLYYATIRTR